MNKIYHYKHSLLYAKSATTLLLPFYKSVASSFHLCPYFQEYLKVSEANCFFSKSRKMDLFSCQHVWNRRSTLTKARKFRIHMQGKTPIKLLVDLFSIQVPHLTDLPLLRKGLYLTWVTPHRQEERAKVGTAKFLPWSVNQEELSIWIVLILFLFLYLLCVTGTNPTW